MSVHECVIGMYYDYNNAKLVTVNELLEEIHDDLSSYNYISVLFNTYGITNKKIKPPYTLKDYCDKRKSTNLTRFEFCPYCGKKIDWKKIKEENNTK